jgi:hypothetical protein
MRTLIFAFAVGLAFAASTQAVPVWRDAARIELGAASFIELVRDGCGRSLHGTVGATNGAIGTGATVFRTGVPKPGAQVGTIHNQIGAVPSGLR